MMTLVRRNSAGTDHPLSTISRLMDSIWNEPIFAPAAWAGLDEGTLALDISEDDRNVFVRASLPGFGREDVQVEVHDGVLTIKAEHSEEREDKNERFYRRERRVGSLSRRVALPGPVIEDESRAELRDGVLTLTLPKTKPETPKRVAIN